MGITTESGYDYVLSPELVRQLVLAEELPLRSREIPEPEASIILRRGSIIGSRIERHIRVFRTMDRSRELIINREKRGESFPSGFVILADELTGSKGRFHRTWHAPEGGLWLTIIIVDVLLAPHRHLYPLVAGISCCELVRSYGVDSRIKWVNDVNVQGKKIVGILTETMIGPCSGEEYILIGIGMNVNNESFPSELAPMAVSLRNLLGSPVDLELLAGRLLTKFIWNIGLLLHEEERSLQDEDMNTGSQQLLDQWRSLSDSIGKRVFFGYDVQAKIEYEAEVIGLDHQGFLQLRHIPSGTILTENSGEILYLP